LGSTARRRFATVEARQVASLYRELAWISYEPERMKMKWNKEFNDEDHPADMHLHLPAPLATQFVM